MEDHKFEKEQLSKGFFSWVFYMDEKMKTELINIGQYIGLALFFYSFLIYFMNLYLPFIDETNSSIEIIIRLLVFVYILFYSIYFINNLNFMGRWIYYWWHLLDKQEIWGPQFRKLFSESN